MKHPRPLERWRRSVLTAAATLALGTMTTPTLAADATDPTLADTPVPAVQFSSSLRDYRSLQPTGPTPWLQANEQVTQHGGWRAYAREANAPEANTPEPSTSEPTPPENAHAHHHHHH